MKNKGELSNADVCVRMSKPGLEGGAGMGMKVDKGPPTPSPPPLSPLRGLPLSPSSQTKIKSDESPISVISSCSSHAPSSPRPLASPPSSIPGAEVKGKPGTPIPSGSVKSSTSRPSSAGGEETKPSTNVATSGNSGGRLTFFKEGKFLLELSHRTDNGAPAGWVAVKSKTYWPPPSSATTTTTQHPLRHDTPTSQSVSDDCSSLNSSPWTGDHVRKQSVPRRNKSSVLQSNSFFWRVQSIARDMRKGVRLSRNPFANIAAPAMPSLELSQLKLVTKKTVMPDCTGSALQERKMRLETKVQMLGEKFHLKLDTKVSVQVLFEKPSPNAEPIDPTFVSPRKRYLRQMESDQESLHRKKLHSIVNNIPHIPVERPSSSSSPAHAHPHPNKSAINSQTSSVYSIDSILNSESANRKSDSFLRTLLKPETKPSGTQLKPSASKERVGNDVVASSLKVERPERTERSASDRLEQLSNPDLRFSPDRYDLSRYGGLASLYGLNPYLDPRYLMLQTLAPGLVPPMSSSHTEMAQAAQAVAAAAAVAAAGLGSYPLNHLHPSLAGTQYPHLLSGGIPSGYTPPTSVASQLLRSQAQSSRASPHPLAHSPSPNPHQASSTPASPRLSQGASPRGASSPWQPPPPPLAHPHSPHLPLSSPLPSPPPQDAPLNLSLVKKE